MFDNQNGIAFLHQFVQYIHQHTDIFEMKPGSRLVQNVDRPAGIAFGQFGRQLDPLAFAAGQRRTGLAELNIS